MESAIYSLKHIKTADGRYGNVPLPYILNSVESEPLSPERALELGADLNDAVDNFGKPLFSPEEVQAIRCATADHVTVNGTMLSFRVPTQSSMLEHIYAEKEGMTPAITTFDTIETTLAPSVPIQEMPESGKSHTTGTIPKLLPRTDGREKEVYVGGGKAEGKITTYKKEGKSLTAAHILEALTKKYKICIFKGNIYIFLDEKGYFEKISNDRFYHLINKEFGSQILSEGNLNLYYQAKGFIKKEASFAVDDEYIVPRDFFVFKDLIFNISTGELFSNNGNFFVTSALQANYNPEAECPCFETFLQNISGGDGKIVELIWQVCGYLFSHDMSAKSFFVFFGEKDTGKSVLTQVLEAIIGHGVVRHLSLNDFGGRFDVAELNDAHLNICGDLTAAPLSMDAVGKIKSFTGNDYIRSDVKNRESVTFLPTAHLLFASNHRILISGGPDEAFFDRLVEVPFHNPVPKERQDPDLLEKLAGEADGICAKALAAYLRLRENSYIFPKVKQESISCFNKERLFEDFIDKRLIVTGRSEDIVPIDIVWQCFGGFCEERRIPLEIKKPQFSKLLKESLGTCCSQAKKRFDGYANPVSVLTGVQIIV